MLILYGDSPRRGGAVRVPQPLLSFRRNSAVGATAIKERLFRNTYYRSRETSTRNGTRHVPRTGDREG